MSSIYDSCETPAQAKLIKASAELRAVLVKAARAATGHQRAWIAAARYSFRPGSPEPCKVCSRYLGLAEAHHIFPLASQYQLHGGARPPVHDAVWLCPTHHAAADRLFGWELPHLPHFLSDAPPEEAEALLRLARRGRNIRAEMLDIPGEAA